MNKWNAFKIERLYTTPRVYAYTNYKQVLEYVVYRTLTVY